MKKLSSLLVLMLVMSILVVPVQAKDIDLMSAGTPNAKIDTSALQLESVDYRLGIRSVSVDGNEEMYKSDINLDDGLRLLDLEVTFVPGTDKADQYLDLARFSLGDVADPTPTYNFQAKEYGLYDFGVKRTEREYYYNDASKDTKEGAADTRAEYDLAEYDFTRTQDSMHLTITPEGLPKFYIAKNRLQREGLAKLPQEVYASHAVYQMNTPLNQVSENATVGTEFSYAGFDVNLAHTQDSYNAASSATLGDPFDESNTPVEDVNGQYNTQETRILDRAVDELNVHKTIGNKLDVTLHAKDTRGNGSFSTNGYLKSAIGSYGPYDGETSDGTAFIGNDVDGDGIIQDDEKFFQQAKSAYGSTKSDSFVGSVDATYLINNDTYLHSGYKTIENDYNIDVYSFASDGNPWQSVRFIKDENGNVVAVLDETNPQSLSSKYFYNYKDKYYVKGEHYFNDNLKANLGYVYEKEEDRGNIQVKYGAPGGEETESAGYQLGFLYNPIKTVELNVDYENIGVKDSEATDKEVGIDVKWEATDSLTVAGKYNNEKQEDIGGAYLGSWAADVGLSSSHLPANKENESKTLSVNYQPLANLSLGFAYGNNTYETENQFIDYEDPDGYGPDPAVKELVEYTTTMDNDMYNLNVAYQVNDQFNATFHGNFVDGTETFSTTDEAFKTTYNDYGLKLTHAVPSYEDMDVTLDARHVEYDEEESTIGAYGTDANDYSADIITLGLEGGF